mmetsp:Transcript_36806/g.96406  ORF Transcript_36806/g.96406 Transcript_36806/m.96406 type:complete len:384 (+) Transcript_36806:204-1355(+)
MTSLGGDPEEALPPVEAPAEPWQAAPRSRARGPRADLAAVGAVVDGYPGGSPPSQSDPSPTGVQALSHPAALPPVRGAAAAAAAAAPAPADPPTAATLDPASHRSKAAKKKTKKKDKRDKKRSQKGRGDNGDAAAVQDTAAAAAAAAAPAEDEEPQGSGDAEAAIAAATQAAEAAADAPEVQIRARVQRTAASDAHGSLTGVFMVTFSGQIVSADFPYQDSLWCKYKFQYGKDWHPVSGLEEGMSQATRRSQDGRHVCVWNFPIEVTFKSTNPFGWPQIVVVVSGIDSVGRDVVRGYGAQHLPIAAGNYTRVVPTFVPVPSSTLSRLAGYLFGSRAEFVRDSFVADGSGREVTRVRSQGTVKLSVAVVTKDFGRYGFRAGSST